MNNSHDLKSTVFIEHYDKDGELIEKREVPKQESDGKINIKVTNPDGSIDQEVNVPFSSFCYQFIMSLYAKFTNTTPNGKDVNGTTSHRYHNTSMMVVYDYDQVGDEEYYGIVVGDDDGTGEPLAYNNYRLGSLHADGTGASEFEYQHNPPRAATVVSGGKVQFSFSRTFTNSSGAPIDVKEIGVYAGVGFRCCIIRDILPATVTVNNGQVLTVTYTLKVNESEGWTVNFMKIVRHGFFYDHPSPENIVRLNGDSEELTDGAHEMSIMRTYSLYGEDHFGIQVGTSTSGVSATDYCLYNQIDHGEGSGELVYHRHHYTGAQYTASGTYVDLSRPFSNHSDAAVTIEEVSLVGRNTGNVGQGVMLMRTLTGGVTLQPEESVKIKFKLEANI